MPALHRARRASAAEKVLEQVRSRDRDLQKNIGGFSPRTSWIQYPSGSPSLSGNTPGIITTPSTPQDSPTITESRRYSIMSPLTHEPPNSPVINKVPLPPRPRLSRSPSAPVLQNGQNATTVTIPPFPPELLPLLDGEHHTDELAVRFGAGWPLLQQWLVAIGGGNGDGDLGRVSIIYR